MTAPWFGSSPSDFPTRVSSWDWSTTGSVSSRSEYAAAFTVSSYTNYMQSPQQTARTDGGTGITRAVTTTYASGNTLQSWLNSAGIEVLRVRSIGTAQFQLQYWNGSSWTGIGSGYTVTVANTYRWLVDFTGLGSGSGTLRFMIIDSLSAVLLDESASGLTLTSATNVDRLRVYSLNSTSNAYAVGEAFIKDGSAETAYVYNEIITANGTDTDGTGGEPEMDDPGSVNSTATNPDTDYATLSSVGQRRSVTCAARSFGGRVGKGVGFAVRLRRGATGPTDFKPYLKIGGTRYYHPSAPVTATTNFADYWFGWDTDPSTSAAWGASNMESASLEYGIEVA